MAGLSGLAVPAVLAASQPRFASRQCVRIKTTGSQLLTERSCTALRT